MTYDDTAQLGEPDGCQDLLAPLLYLLPAPRLDLKSFLIGTRWHHVLEKKHCDAIGLS